MTPDEIEVLNSVRVKLPRVEDEREHFFICPECEQAVDCRRLGDVLHHDEPGHPRLRRH